VFDAIETARTSTEPISCILLPILQRTNPDLRRAQPSLQLPVVPQDTCFQQIKDGKEYVTEQARTSSDRTLID
jgi:hypothetical protein